MTNPQAHEVRLGRLRSRCPAMHRLFAKVEALALSGVAVLMEGETGSGKAMLAAELHRLGGGDLRGGPLLTLACAGLTAAQLETALQAPAMRRGRNAAGMPAGLLDRARGSTLVLQDVAELDLPAQAALLRCLSGFPSLRCTPTGRSASARLVSLSRVDLGQLVRRGRFRPDLYFRLATAILRVPPLRERLADLPQLAGEAMQAAADQLRGPVPELERDALALLQSCRWPGNLRELQAACTQALLSARGNSRITGRLFETFLSRAEPPADVSIPIGVSLKESERTVILQTLAAHGGNRQATADTLQISRRTLYEKLARYRCLSL